MNRLILINIKNFRIFDCLEVLSIQQKHKNFFIANKKMHWTGLQRALIGGFLLLIFFVHWPLS